MNPTINYETLKAYASTLGVPVKSLISLAPQNDPFYVGAPAQMRRAQWFAQVYQQGQFRHGVHLRRIHYVLLSIEARDADGLPYENTEKAWGTLLAASAAARWLGLVPIGAFDDRKNPPALVYEEEEEHGAYVGVSGDALEIEVSIGGLPALPEIYVGAPYVRQPFALEVWCEKSGANDVLVPLCHQLGATLVTGAGELSITACYLQSRRALADSRPVRILYISDFDPAGMAMPVSVSTKLQFLMFEQDLDVALLPIALTREQVEHYQLPRTPIKESEARRGQFEATHGAGAVELDALEALHPGELRRLVMEAAASYQDATLSSRVRQTYWRNMDAARLLSADVHERHAPEIEAARRERQAIADAFDQALQQWTSTHAPTWKAIAKELDDAAEQASKSLHAYPVAQAVGDVRVPLFHSRRDYFEQLEHYERFRKGQS